MVPQVRRLLNQFYVILLNRVFSENSIEGDVNGDSSVNIQDVILIVNIILSNEQNLSADVNQDGNIDVLDIIQVVNLILE